MYVFYTYFLYIFYTCIPIFYIPIIKSLLLLFLEKSVTCNLTGDAPDRKTRDRLNPLQFGSRNGRT